MRGATRTRSRMVRSRSLVLAVVLGACAAHALFVGCGTAAAPTATCAEACAQLATGKCSSFDEAKCGSACQAKSSSVAFACTTAFHAYLACVAGKDKPVTPVSCDSFGSATSPGCAATESAYEACTSDDAGGDAGDAAGDGRDSAPRDTGGGDVELDSGEFDTAPVDSGADVKSDTKPG